MALASLTYSSIKSKYDNFTSPQALVILNGKNFSDNKAGMIISDLDVELTSGFEASMVTFRIYNCYDTSLGQFKFDAFKSYVLLGSSVVVQIGYYGSVMDVFIGFISKVNFLYERGDMPCIEITGMDIKGIMMANNSSRQLKATTYGDAVSEILSKTPYEKLKTAKAITSLQITDTPDKKPGQGSGSRKTSAETIEMVCESDYEFVVKAAKKFNFEFFTVCGTVYFRKAKCNTIPLIQLSLDNGLLTFDIGYDITGLVESLETRSLDVGKGKLITGKGKLNRKISQGNKAKALIKKSTKVYIDPTISSQEQADYRVQSLLETMSYRLGSLECECVGMPELIPGRFVDIVDLGSPVSNSFYITNVIHSFHNETGYRTKLIGKAAEIKG